MTCDYCQRPMNYAFYINDARWIKVVGEEKFDKNVGRVCAHCTLERLGGCSWYIVWNQPVENIRTQVRETSNERTAQEAKGETTQVSWKCPKCGWRKVQAFACGQCHAWCESSTAAVVVPETPVGGEPRICLTCGHEERFSDNEGGTCEKIVDEESNFCGCVCRFAAPVPAAGDDEGELDAASADNEGTPWWNEPRK